MKSYLHYQGTRQRAFTLIETLLVAGIISIASAAAYITYDKVSVASFVSKEVDFLTGTMDKIASASTATDNFDQFTTTATGSVNPNLLVSGIIQPNFISGTMVVNNRNQNIWFVRSAVGAPAYKAISIVSSGYTSAECSSLISKLQGRFDQISVTGGTTPGMAKTFGGIYDPAQGAAVCNSNNSTLSVSFLYANKGTTL